MRKGIPVPEGIGGVDGPVPTYAPQPNMADFAAIDQGPPQQPPTYGMPPGGSPGMPPGGGPGMPPGGGEGGHFSAGGPPVYMPPAGGMPPAQ